MAKDNIVDLDLTPSNESLRKEIAESGSGKTTEASLGTLYDANKALIKQTEKPLSPSKLREKKVLISQFCRQTNNEYYMLLNNELKYYSLFKVKDKSYVHYDKIAEETIDIFQTDFDAPIYVIDKDEIGGAIEVWVEIDKEMYMFLLFPYDMGLITV